MLCVVLLNVIQLNVVLLNAVMLNVVLLNVVLMSIVVLSVMAPNKHSSLVQKVINYKQKSFITLAPEESALKADVTLFLEDFTLNPQT
jgi:hypothetical protein